MDIDLLRELLHYDPETGEFVWRARDPHHFVQHNAKRALNEEQLQDAADKWNDANAGMPAMTTAGPRGGLAGVIKGRTYQAHTVAYAMHWGHPPVGQIDHYDGDRSNNAIFNLRDVDRKMAGIVRKMRKPAPEGVGVVTWGLHPRQLWGLQWRYTDASKLAPLEGEATEDMVVEPAYEHAPTMMAGASTNDPGAGPTPPPDAQPDHEAPTNPLARGAVGPSTSAPTTNQGE